MARRWVCRLTLMIENRDFVHWQQIMSSEPIDSEPANPGSLNARVPVMRTFAGGQEFQTHRTEGRLNEHPDVDDCTGVAAGAIARELLHQFGVEFGSHVIQLGGVPSEPLSKTWNGAAIPADSPLNCGG